jgi:hypothetical protein
MPQGIIYNACPRARGVMTTPELLLSDFWPIFNWMAVSKFLLDLFGEKGAWAGGGGSFPTISFGFKKLNKNFQFLIKWALWNFYEHLINKNHLFHKGITYNACPRALGGFIFPGVFVIRFLNYFKKMVLLYEFEEKRVWGGGARCPPISFDS